MTRTVGTQVLVGGAAGRLWMNIGLWMVGRSTGNVCGNVVRVAYGLQT